MEVEVQEVAGRDRCLVVGEGVQGVVVQVCWKRLKLGAEEVQAVVVRSPRARNLGLESPVVEEQEVQHQHQLHLAVVEAEVDLQHFSRVEVVGWK